MNFLCSTVQTLNNYGLTEYSKGNYFIYLDKGWIQKDDYFFKGNKSDWCKIYFGESISVQTNKFRSFPIYSNSDTLTNFQKIGNTIPVDGLAGIVDGKVTIKYQEKFYPKIPNDRLSFKECKEILFDAVIENTGTFVANNNKQIMIPSQAGADTLLARSVFDYLGVSYTLFDFDTKPILSRLGDHLAKNFWGFSQVPEFDDRVVVCGFFGDEWVLRNPYYVHILMSGRGISITEKFDSIKNCYMKKYFESYRNKCSVASHKSREKLLTEICNDFQIWHLNSTIFFSPFKHESLLTLLAADTETVLSQVTNAELTKSVMEMLNPTLVNQIDAYKNQNDPDFFW